MKLRFSFNKDPSEAHLVSKGPFVCFRLKDLGLEGLFSGFASFR